MKKRIFFGTVIALFLVELAVLLLFALPKEEKLQDTVAINEAVQTIQSDWNSPGEHGNPKSLEYVILDLHGTVLYRTKEGLSESMNTAISHKDTILDIEVDGAVAGKLIIYNNDAAVFQAEKQAVILAMLLAMVLQCCICVGCFFYLRWTVIKPFEKMKRFAERVAGGNLDIPLVMDRQNLFGAFTESCGICLWVPIICTALRYHRFPIACYLRISSVCSRCLTISLPIPINMRIQR